MEAIDLSSDTHAEGANPAPAPSVRPYSPGTKDWNVTTGACTFLWDSSLTPRVQAKRRQHRTLTAIWMDGHYHPSLRICLTAL